MVLNQDRICSRNQPVISNKGNGSCSMKQLGPLMGLLAIAPRQPYVITCMRLYNVIDWQCDNVTNIVVHYISKQLLQFYNTFIFPIIIHNDKYKTYFTRLIRLIYYIAYGWCITLLTADVLHCLRLIYYIAYETENNSD